MDNATPRPIRILLVEDHGIVRAGIRMLIENSPGQTVVGEAAGRDPALDMAAHTQPDIILLDVYLGAESSLNWLPELRAAAPQARVLLLTAVRDRAEHRRAVRLGAVGIVLKDQAASVLATAIEKVHAGEAWLDRTMVATVLSDLVSPGPEPAPDPAKARIATLTERECEVVALVAEGHQNKQIAQRLSISETTVTHHLTNIFNKLGVASRLELVIFAYRHGLAKPPDPAAPDR
jgi:two-component system, NarL family, nitrate/nitrite response regulator NarL